MANEILTTLLNEYEQKRIKAEIDLEKRKELLYSEIPELQDIEDELHKYAILTAKNILKNKDYSLSELNNEINILKQKKEFILKQHNLDLSVLQPNYSCKLCNDTGYVQDSKTNKTVLCTCLKQKLLNISYNKSNIYNLCNENFSTFNPNIFSDETNLAKYKSNISPRSNMKYIKQKCEEFVENFDNFETKNLLFTGNTGLRKNLYVKLYC